MWSSWNAPSCCGEAKANKLDDFGFLDAVVTDAAASLPVARGALFGSGFSNGGFVTSLLPSRSTHTWRGLAPVAGHEYEFDAPAPVPVSMHHCEADRAVQLGGCCEGGPACCCGIGAGRSGCVGAAALHARWLSLNRCKGARRAVGVGGAVCHVGHGCAANVSLCVFPRDGGCYHAQWARQFAGAEGIVQFFVAEVGDGCDPPHADGERVTCGWSRLRKGAGAGSGRERGAGGKWRRTAERQRSPLPGW